MVNFERLINQLAAHPIVQPIVQPVLEPNEEPSNTSQNRSKSNEKIKRTKFRPIIIKDEPIDQPDAQSNDENQTAPIIDRNLKNN